MTTSCGQILYDVTHRLRAVGVPSARLDARLLLAHATGISAMEVFSHPERQLSDAEQGRLNELVVRRERREPMSHILGQREFWSLPFRVTADTLDPRPDTETLVEAVLSHLPDRQAPLRLLDLGTGSGCILLALLSELPHATGVGVDASTAALTVAAANAGDMGLAERTHFVQGDWGQGLEGPYDVILSNPPYIPDGEIDALEPEVACFEPRSALAGGSDGLDCYRQLAPQMVELLAPDGLGAFEVGKGQDQAVAALLRKAGLRIVETRADLAGIHRCVVFSHPIASQP